MLLQLHPFTAQVSLNWILWFCSLLKKTSTFDTFEKQTHSKVDDRIYYKTALKLRLITSRLLLFSTLFHRENVDWCCFCCSCTSLNSLLLLTCQVSILSSNEFFFFRFGFFHRITLESIAGIDRNSIAG